MYQAAGWNCLYRQFTAMRSALLPLPYSFVGLAKEIDLKRRSESRSYNYYIYKYRQKSQVQLQICELQVNAAFEGKKT